MFQFRKRRGLWGWASFSVLTVLIVATLGSLTPSSASLAQEGERIVTLGEDLTTAQENEVLRLLGASRQDRIITVTSQETSEGSRGIIEIPPGTPAISSTSIVCRPEGSGIDVRTQNIEEVTAGMYAQSLLTAGITDADVRVVAPSDAPAEGLTALTGIFKAYRQSPCVGGELDPQRERLAQRELATTVELGEALGDREAATEVVLETQEQVVSRKLRSRDEIAQVVDAQLRNRGGGDVPADERNRLIDLMVDLGSPNVDWGGYSQGWTLQRENRNQVRISARPPAQATAGATATAGPAEAAGDTVQGTVTDIAGNQLTVNRTEGGPETIPAGGNIRVVRNGQPATLGDIQCGDRVTVERDPNGRATRIVATSTGAGAAAGSVITGVVTADAANSLRVRTRDGAARDIPVANTQGLEVVRNGQPARYADIRPTDNVTVTLRADGVPTRIVATSTAALRQGGDTGPNPAWLLALLPLFLLMRSGDEEVTIRQAQRVRQSDQR